MVSFFRYPGRIRISLYHVGLTILFLFLLFFGAFIGYAVSIGEWFYNDIYLELPQDLTVSPHNLQQSTYYYDKQDKIIYQEYYDVNRTIVAYENIPQHLIDAIIAIEDQEFYSHQGISPRGILRAAYNNYVLKSPDTQGGSTITQQLVKNTFLTPERTLERKLKEIILSLRIEQNYSKQEILALYLNTVSFGGTAYGIEAASQTYFGHPTDELTLAESAILAGLPAAPSEYTPYNDVEKTRERQLQVLNAMVETGTISWQEARDTFQLEIDVVTPTAQISHPHFVYYAQQYLAKIIGEEELQNGGLHIHTSIDPPLQHMAELAIRQATPELEPLNISNASSLITKNTTGEIVAMVGSKNYYADDIDGFVNTTTALRQPGSSIKPFNYALYLENGHTLTSLIKDAAITYKVPHGEDYTPKNYDNTFRGNVTVRRALANSLNIPAVKAIDENGVEEFATYVQKFGIEAWPKETYGLALTLGSGEVRMTNMNEAFSVFPNKGVRKRLNPIRYVINREGDVVYYNPCLYDKTSFGEVSFIHTPPPCEEQVIPRDIAFLITSVLTDQQARREGFGANSVLNVDGAGAKTGTTNDFRDNWTFGFNKEFTVGVWVGNNDNTPMSPVVSGVTGAAPIWNTIISELTVEHNSIDVADEKPPTVEQVKVCAQQNLLPCESCGGTQEYYINGTAPTRYCVDPEPEEEEDEDDEDDDDDDDD